MGQFKCVPLKNSPTVSHRRDSGRQRAETIIEVKKNSPNCLVCQIRTARRTRSHNIDSHVRLLGVDEGALLDHLRHGVASQEWEHSGLEDGQPIAGYFLDGALVSAAGYEVWGGTLAHIGVTTHAGRRSLGFGRACVRGIAEEAIKRGLVAQYQTLFENEPSIAVARS